MNNYSKKKKHTLACEFALCLTDALVKKDETSERETQGDKE